MRRHRGTPLFVAPEIITAGIAHCAADAWSYGVLVYTLLVGFPPFFMREHGTTRELEEQARTLAAAAAAPRRAAPAVDVVSRASHRSRAACSGSRRRFGTATRARCVARCIVRRSERTCGVPLPSHLVAPRAVPAQSQDFIKKLLVVDETGRMTMAGALKHPWLVSSE